MQSLTSFALISLAFAASVAAEECSTDSLLSLASNKNLASCTADTGVSVSTISTLTHEQIMDVCKSSSCMALMSDVAALSLGDCTIPGSNVSVQSDILDNVASMCTGSGSMGSMGSSSNGTTNVGDESGESSKTSDNSTGSKSGSTSSATTVTTSLLSAAAAVFVAMVL
ncbi:GPI-anchored serine-glycine rich Elicitin INL3a-like protein [Phytophthora palmivora]|uniref:Elicitin n=1 Tax=Phytophthora palmivora TaxID=4796 RepID=A0A2P4X153_9STRA|nr:GPI-anchored serine-glycine rich Elicitin INL3a-like protein [Phytophthora palmivora]